jgi:hypothetical protein
MITKIDLTKVVLVRDQPEVKNTVGISAGAVCEPSMILNPKLISLALFWCGINLRSKIQLGCPAGAVFELRFATALANECQNICNATHIEMGAKTSA